MQPLSALFAQGTANAWLFVPSAILLGALHGLEPGHSKTMMAAFIIAVRGTVIQAVLLGVAAAISHTAVVWAVALIGLSYGARFNAEASEPYFQIASAVLIVAIALWMLWRAWGDLRARKAHDAHSHAAHAHDTHLHEAHDHHSHDRDIDHHHAPAAAGYQDAHALAHARDIEQRFAGRPVTNGQIVMFGLTGGLIPCPAAITVLLLCLQLKQFTLGVTLVLCFSIGLAITMVAAGTIAALGVRHVSGRWSGFDAFARLAPLVSSGLIALMGLYLGWLGWAALTIPA